MVELRILEVIAYEHDITGHTEMDAAWKAIDSHYYGIVREEVRQAIRKCQICARKASNRSRGLLTPILVKHLFERM